MSDDYAEYEKKCAAIREENDALLLKFEAWLLQNGLGAKTVRRHVDNIEFYVNEFLLYEEAIEAKDGASSSDMFLGYWFIRKSAWASVSSLRSNATSLKKFYAFMAELGHIDEDALQGLKMDIKEGLPEWLATLDRYDDDSITDPGEVWGL